MIHSNSTGCDMRLTTALSGIGNERACALGFHSDLMKTFNIIKVP